MTHESIGELILLLVAPDGTEMYLANLNAFQGSGTLDRVIFDDGVTTNFSYASYVENVGYVFSGAYKPLNSLSDLNGTSITGTWQLKLKNPYVGKIGTLTEFRLEVMTK